MLMRKQINSLKWNLQITLSADVLCQLVCNWSSWGPSLDVTNPPPPPHYT